MVVFVLLENLHRSEGRVKNFYPSIQSMEVLFTDVRLEFLSENVRPAIFLFPFRAVPASVFLHIITIRCQAVCKHHAAFAIGLFVQIVPLSVNEYPAALHACLRIKIEPAAISAVADPSGRCVAVLAESPPVSIDRNPLMRSSNSSDNHCQSHKAVFFPSRLPSWYYEGSNIFKFPHTSQIAQVLHSTRLGGTYGILFTTG